MPYARNRLSTLVYANGFTLWHYLADPDMPESGQTSSLSRYFKPATSLLRQGDMILLSGAPRAWTDAVRAASFANTYGPALPGNILSVTAADPEQQCWTLHSLTQPNEAAAGGKA